MYEAPGSLEPACISEAPMGWPAAVALVQARLDAGWLAGGVVSCSCRTQPVLAVYFKVLHNGCNLSQWAAECSLRSMHCARLGLPQVVSCSPS